MMISTSPRRLDAHRDALARRADRRLDVVGDADPAQSTARARRAARWEIRPTPRAACAFHVAEEVARIVGQTHRGGIRQLFAADQVAPRISSRSSPSARPRCRAAVRSRTSLRAGRRRETEPSARCW